MCILLFPKSIMFGGFSASCLSRHYVAHYSEWESGSILHIRPCFTPCSLEQFSARYKLRWPMGSLGWTVRHTWKEHLWVLDFGPCVIYKYTNQILIRCENKVIRPFAIPLQPRGCFHSLCVSGSCPKKFYELGSCGGAENDFAPSKSGWRAKPWSDLVPV